MGNNRLIHANELHLISPDELKKATVKMVDTLHLAAGSTEGFNIYEVVKAYFTDLEKVMGYGIMSMPALVVNAKVVSMGKVLKRADVEKLLESYDE